MNYNQAKSRCERVGGILATWSENMNVQGKLLGYAVEQRHPTEVYIWIGASYNSVTEQTMWSDGHEVDVKVARFTNRTNCGCIYKV